MTKLELEAIRSLPEEYVKDGTCTCLFNGYVVAMEAKLPALLYKEGKWIPMDSGEPTFEKVRDLTRYEAELIGLPVDPKANAGKLFDGVKPYDK